MGIFETHNAKNYCVGSGVALQTPIPLYTTDQKRCFGCLGSVYLKPTMPKNTCAHQGPEKVFWIPRMGVFDMHDAKKNCVGSGVALQTHIPVHTTGQKRCLWIPRVGVFETHNAKKDGVGSGVALQTRIPVHTTGQKRCFRIRRVGVFETHNAKKTLCGFWGGTPNTHT